MTSENECTIQKEASRPFTDEPTDNDVNHYNENKENISPNNARTVANSEDIALTKKDLPRKRKPKSITPQMRKQLKVEKKQS